MVDGVEDRRRRRDQRRLADALGTVGAERFRILDEKTFDLGHVADRRNEIIVQILGSPRQIFLHQSEADALRDTAMDLTFDLSRVDGTADVVRGGDAGNLDGPESGVDLDLRQLGGEGVARIGHALTFLVERRRRRIEMAGPGQHVAALVRRREDGEVYLVHHAAIGNAKPPLVEHDPPCRPRPCPLENLPPQRLARELRRGAGNEGLARGGGLAGIGGKIGVAGDEMQRRDRNTERVGADLSHDRVRALADIDGAAIERDASVTVNADAHRRRVR